MRFAFAVFVATLLSGCTTFQRWAAVEPLTAIEAKLEYCTWLEKEYNTKTNQRAEGTIQPLCGPTDRAPKTDNSIKTAESGSGNGPVNAIQTSGDRSATASAESQTEPALSPRDYLINLMMVSDRVCARDLARMSSDQRTINASLSTTSTALSSAASTVTGGLADNILSGGAALLGASRDHINAEVYRTTQPEIVTLLIQTDREEMARALLVAKPERTFSQQETIYYANKYHQACSQYHGLALLSEAATNKAKEIKDQQSSLRSISMPEKEEKKTEKNEGENTE